MLRHPYRFCSNMRGTMSPQMYSEQENSKMTSLQHHKAPGRASWPSPQGRAAQRELPSPHRSFTISALQDPWEGFRPVQSSCSAHGLHIKQGDAVIQLLLVFSSVSPHPWMCLQHLLRSPYSAAMGSQLIFRTSLAFPGMFYCQSTIPWAPGDTAMPGSDDLPIPVPTSSSAIHSPCPQLTVTWLPPSNIQSSFLSQFWNYL